MTDTPMRGFKCYRVTGDDIAVNGNAFFTTSQAVAIEAAVLYAKNKGLPVQETVVVVVTSDQDLAWHLNNAVGY